MKPGTNVFVGVLLASLFLAPHAFAQQATPAPKKPAPTPVFVPLPKDIECAIQELKFTAAKGTGPKTTGQDGTLKSITCRIAGKTPQQQKEIRLVSPTITHGFLLTRDFGKLRILPGSGSVPTSPAIAIRRETLPAFRLFLQGSTLGAATAGKNTHIDTEAATPHPVVRPPAKYSETRLAIFRADGDGGFSPYWVAYILPPGKDSTDKSYYVELNGTKLGPYDLVSPYVRLSPDQQHIAFAAKKGDGWTLVIDGVEKYSSKQLYWSAASWAPALRSNVFSNEVNAAVFAFMPGSAFVYLAAGDDGLDHVFVNGVPGPGFGGFSSHLAWAGGALLATGFTDKKPTEIHGTKQFGPYDSLSYEKISDDELHYAVQVTNGDTSRILYDDRSIEPKGNLIDFTIGPHGEIAYAYKSGAQIKVVFNEEEYPDSYSDVKFLTISPDGKELAFWAKNGSQWVLTAGKKAYPGGSGYFVYYAGDVYSLMWSNDSEHILYYVRNNSGSSHTAVALLDGNVLKQSYAPAGMMVMGVIQDDDGSICGEQMMGNASLDTGAVVEAALHEGNTVCVPESSVMIGSKLSCIVRPPSDDTAGNDKATGPERVIFGDKEEGPYKRVRSRLSATKDGKHYGYIVESDQGWQVVADGILRPAIFEEVFRTYINEEDKTFEYLALKGGNLYHVVQPFAAEDQPTAK